MQASVIAQLIERGVSPQHQWRTPTAESSAVRGCLTQLIQLGDDAAVVTRLEGAISGLGDPAATLAAATKKLQDASLPEGERIKAQEDADQATGDLARLGRLQRHRNTLDALVVQACAFSDAVTTVASSVQQSALAIALSVEPLTVSGAPDVLVLPGANAQTDQVVIKRLFRSPHVQVSTSVHGTFFLVEAGFVTAADRASASVSFANQLTQEGAKWKPQDPLPASPSGVTTTAAQPAMPPKAPRTFWSGARADETVRGGATRPDTALPVTDASQWLTLLP